MASRAGRGSRLMTGGVALLSAAAMMYGGCASFGQNPTGDDLTRVRRSPHYGEETFVNTVATRQGFDAGRMQYLWDRLFDDDAARSPVETGITIPVERAPRARFAAPWTDGVRATWVGHSTVLLELDGMRVLADPIWSDRCSPVSWAGPQRFHEPGVAFDDLPELDAVIISHDHYDHLDQPTIERLAKRGVTFYVPLGVGSHLKKWGVTRVVELDWWGEAVVTGKQGQKMRLIATPARHFSGRGPIDRDRTLWASWAIVGPTQRAWFGGDTGYFQGFKEIGERLGPFDLTIIPIGAYDEAWRDVHLNPEEAVQAHLDVRGRAMMPIHWGTFNLGFHAWNEPPQRLLRAAQDHKVTTLQVPKPGQSVRTSAALQVERWWLK